MTIRVMLVDDDPDEKTLLAGLLESAGAQIDMSWAGTYPDALEAMASNRADVYLVDYKLGPASGLELLTEAREQGCDAPVLLVTGYGDHAVDLAAARAGAAGYLVKGEFDGEALERSIRYAVAPRQSAKRTARPGDLLLQVALARGATVREAARVAGISERTAHRRNSDPEFREEVDGLRNELRERLMAELVTRMVEDRPPGA